MKNFSEKKKDISVEEFKNLIQIRTFDIPTEGSNNVLGFVLTSQFDIILTYPGGHASAMDELGIDDMDEIKEGYVRSREDGNIEIDFRTMHPVGPGFHGTAQEYENLKQAVREKIIGYIKNKQNAPR